MVKVFGVAVEATHKAIWVESQSVYRCGDWTSEDGDNWLDSSNGELPTGKDFERAHILLIDGPRDGVMVG